MADPSAGALRALVQRAKEVAIGLDRAAGGMKVAEAEYPELKQLGMSELFRGTADLLRDLLEAFLVEGPQVSPEKEQEQGTRVDGERRTAGPTGSTASGNKATPAFEGGVRQCVHGSTPLGSWCRQCNPFRR